MGLKYCFLNEVNKYFKKEYAIANQGVAVVNINPKKLWILEVFKKKSINNDVESFARNKGVENPYGELYHSY